MYLWSFLKFGNIFGVVKIKKKFRGIPDIPDINQIQIP